MLNWNEEYLTYGMILDEFGKHTDMFSGNHHTLEISYYKIYIAEFEYNRYSVYIHSTFFNGVKSIEVSGNKYQVIVFETLEEAKSKAFEWLIEISRSTLEEINRKVHLDRKL